MNHRLSVENVSLSFGGLVVADDISLSLPPGSRTALIGPNGAGKSTLVNIISGALKPTKGIVRADGVSITHLGQAERARAGVVRTFQTSRLFSGLTVADNLRIAALHRCGLERSVCWGNKTTQTQSDVQALMTDLRIAHLGSHQVDKLSMGEQRIVEIGLALALRPRVLLLDEPAAGVPQGESAVIFESLRRLPDDMAVLLIEHDMDIVFEFASQIAVLVAGRLLITGSPAEIAANDEVNAIYFGKSEARNGH